MEGGYGLHSGRNNNVFKQVVLNNNNNKKLWPRRLWGVMQKPSKLLSKN
jgi:hypothetical protein